MHKTQRYRCQKLLYLLRYKMLGDSVKESEKTPDSNAIPPNLLFPQLTLVPSSFNKQFSCFNRSNMLKIGRRFDSYCPGRSKSPISFNYNMSKATITIFIKLVLTFRELFPFGDMFTVEL